MTQRQEMEREWRAGNRHQLVRWMAIGLVVIGMAITGGAYLASCIMPQPSVPDDPPNSGGPDSPM